MSKDSMPQDPAGVGPRDVPAPELCVLRQMLDRAAAARPDHDFVRFWRGETWSYAETLARVRRRAAALRAEGVERGDHVLCWMGNGPDLLTTWFAINWLGAVYVPLNTGALGRPLEHMLKNADARLMVADPRLVGRLSGLERGALSRVLLTGPAPEKDLPEGLDLAPLTDPEGEVADPSPEPAIMPWEPQAILYTSGTTGPPKGVLFGYAQHWTMGPEAIDGLGPEDVYLCSGPLFHCGTTLFVYAALARGATIAMIPEFRTEDFWPAVRETGATVTLLLGVMAAFLLKRPPDAADRDHPLRSVHVVPFSEDALALRDRFGVKLNTLFNMTEVSSPIVAPEGVSALQTAGRLRAPFEARIVDEHDIEVPEGETGELILRSLRTWALFLGYYRNPEATAAVLRNGWFHTGDAFRRDADGTYYYLDRLKDVIRRRGENISSVELEAEIAAHPQVREAAAVAVPSEFSEDEVMAVVAPAEGAQLDPAELIRFLARRVARYMVPRYVRVMPELPKTASGKLQKQVLRAEGITPEVWDREAAGLDLRKEGAAGG
ncbi:MAG: AMP-binding protein [Pseudomonadota bacterium]